MAVQIKVQPKVTATTPDEEQLFVKADLPVRYLMIMIGAFPACCIPELSKPIRVISGILQGILAILLFTITILWVLTLTAWKLEQDGDDISAFKYKIFFLVMSLTTPLDCLLFAVTGTLMNTFAQHYNQLKVVLQLFSKLSVTTSYRLTKTCMIAILAFGVTAALGYATPLIYDLYDQRWNLDPFFNMANSDNSTSSMSAVNILSKAFLFVSTIHIPLKLVYFYSVIIKVVLLFRSFNHHLDLRIRTQPDLVADNLAAYRHTHLELRKLAETINSLFRFQLATMICAYSIGILLVFYLVSLGIAQESNLRGILLFWCIAFFVFLWMAILACQILLVQVSCTASVSIVCCIQQFPHPIGSAVAKIEGGFSLFHVLFISLGSL